MRALILTLLVVLGFLQYGLWLSPDGITQSRQLEDAVAAQRQQNLGLQERNRRLQAEVTDLKEGVDAIEARARRDLGMIREGETFFQFVEE